MHVDVGNFLGFNSCVLYSELEYPAKPLINVEVVAHVTRPEFRCSEVSTNKMQNSTAVKLSTIFFPLTKFCTDMKIIPFPILVFQASNNKFNL